MTTILNGLIELSHEQIQANNKDYMQKYVNDWLIVIADTQQGDDKCIRAIKEALFELGKAEQSSFWKLNDRLKHPLQKLMNDSKGGGKGTQLLKELQSTVIHIKPPKKSLISGLFNTFRLLFSWSQSTWDLWLESYPIYKQQIKKTIGELKSYQKQLNRDNKILLGDQKDMEFEIEKLKNCFNLVCSLADALKAGMIHNAKLNEASHTMIDEEFLPPIQQRIIELQQQLLIARQAVMTIDLIINQNESQIRGIDQAVYTTTSAVDVTAGIVLVEQSNKRLAQFNKKSESIDSSSNKQKLKQARHLIDQALNQMDEVRHETIKLTDQITPSQVAEQKNVE